MNNNKLIYEEYACWGCKACEVACKQEYNQQPFRAYTPNGQDSIRYVSVQPDGPKVVDDNLYFMFRVNVCLHCSDPACVKACPEGALNKDPATGIVLHAKEKCNGCNAVLGKSGAEKQETSPCKFNCPARNDIQGCVNLAAKGKYQEALQLIKETSPFPSICGRVCHHACEADCNRKEIDEAVSIQSIERFVAEQDYQSKKPYIPQVKEAKPDKVAVIGSGPAGLSAAYFLAREGYPVTVFEKMPKVGGMMSLGIPAYRLPREVINRDIAAIQKMGVAIKTNVAFGKDVTLESLKKSGYKAVFLATGLHQNRNLNVKNEEVKGILKGVDFLRDVALGKPVSIGKKVVVIGGGNVAIDVALTTVRGGAKDVSLVCLEDRNEMPAWEHEIAEAVEDGVKIINCFGPNKFLEQNDRLTGIEFKRCMCVFDECGTFDPRYDLTDLKTLDADTVIIAIGQTADLSFIENENISINPGARIAADPVTLQTSRPGVFAGGDVFYGPKSVVEAIGSGREAALSIDRFLKGLSLTLDRNKPLTPIKKPYMEKYDSAKRSRMPCLTPEVRTESFAEVGLGFTAEMIARESKRCVSCGSSCIQACPYDAISFNAYTGKTEKCNLCYNRVINGLYPACADNVCLAHCIHFGDPAEIAKKIAEKRKLRGGWGEIIPKAISYSRNGRP